MIQQTPLSPMELFLARANELRERRTAQQPTSSEPPTVAKLVAEPAGLSLREKRRFANEAWQARCKAQAPPSCCSQCGAEGRVTKRLKLCAECKFKREQQRSHKNRVYRLVSNTRDYRQELQVYFETALEQDNCPLCGVPIHPELPACAKHTTIVLMRAMRGRPTEV